MALSKTVGFVFRRRYNLSPYDPLFLDCPHEDMIIDVYAHAHADDPKLREAVVTEDYEAELAAFEAEPVQQRPAPPDDFDLVVEDKY